MVLRRIAPSASILVLLLSLVWPVFLVAADSASDSGNVTIEIVPPTDGGVSPNNPGSPGNPASPGSPASPGGTAAQEPQPASGTLSATLMWLPDPAMGQSRLHGMLAVQDHRARADGWTVRLQGDPANTTYVVEVVVGQTGFGIPDWLYEGIHFWDVAVGAPIGEAPQVVTAPKPSGYDLTIHQLWINVDTETLPVSGAKLTLVVILPSAP